MGKSNIVVFVLSQFLGQVSGKGQVSEADILGRIVKGIAQIA